MIRRISWILLSLLSLLAFWTFQGHAHQAGKQVATGNIEFNRDIRPILSDNCFLCHGPDPANRKAGLRLDTEDGLFKPQGGDAPVVKGQPQASELLRRITAEDASERMPPAKSHKKLTDAQKTLVRQWIEQGAPWQPHWSLVKPGRPPLPEVRDEKWPRNPIDRFILAKLEEKGLKPSPEADRHELIRRLAFDLTGLPPAPEDVEAFVNDTSADAYERLVDRLLASTHFGEHRARYWLDCARYADTNGLHFDNYREIWPYRDWVIEAFNRNMPFDRFTIEQIAGDLLPNRTLEQQIATGFHRCNITTNEGGSIDEEVVAAYAKDRVETTGAVWLGLTTGCAACHNHKYDPISQKEFYQFVAFFRNTTQRAMDGNIPDTPPILVVPTKDDRARWEGLQTEVASLKASREKRRADGRKSLDAWLAGPESKLLDDPLDASRLELGLALYQGEGQQAVVITGQKTTLTLPPEVSWSEGKDKGRALRFGTKAGLPLEEASAFNASNPFTLAFWVWMPTAGDNFEVLSKIEGSTPDRQHGWILEINQRIPALTLFGNGKQDKLSVRGNNGQRLKAGAWNHVCFTGDGTRRPDGFLLFIDGKLQTAPRSEPPPLQGSLATLAPLTVGFAGRNDFKGGAIQDLRVYSRELRQDEVTLLFRWPALHAKLTNAPKSLIGAEREELLTIHLSREDAEYRNLSQQLAAREIEQRIIRFRGAVTHVMQERADGMPTAKVLFRGQYDQPRETVQADVPAAFPPLPAGASKNRMGLAQWLVSPENPLTARVTVNRMWQEVFGTGLVKTSEDFGIMGESPSHPELLDWLAVEFRQSAWDIKHMYKLLTTSAAYRQLARTTDAGLKADPQNRLLWRGPRFRLDAEMVRDLALASSGLLNRQIGGPSVKPYHPAGVWETVAMLDSNTRFYKQDSGDKLYRRSMYTFWKRGAPPAAMDIFNAPNRESCTVRRERTNTPLQALVTMNDPQFVEAARCLAQLTLKEKGDFGARLNFLTQRLLSRDFDKNERQICDKALTGFMAHYRSRPEEARKLIQTGASAPDVVLSPVDLAAWTMLASQVMNLDEALNK
jgi:mono/diheme cytochrome c family protein